MGVHVRIDDGAAARAVGLELPADEPVLEGDPRIGTVLMQTDEDGAELPLRVLVWASHDGTQVAFPDPEQLAAAFHLDDRTELLSRMRSGLAELVAEATA
jgi:uncharacterized protein (DUF302 family)